MLVEHFANRHSLIISESYLIPRALEWESMCTSAQGNVRCLHSTIVRKESRVIYEAKLIKVLEPS